MARYGKKSPVYARDFLPYLATFVCSPNLPVDCECGEKEREDFIAVIEGSLVPRQLFAERESSLVNCL